MRQPRDSQGRFKRKQVFGAVIIGLLLVLAVGASMLGTYPITYAEDKILTEVDDRDSIQKVTDNIAEKARAERESAQLVKRAEIALLEAEELNAIHNEALNDAVDAFNLYQSY